MPPTNILLWIRTVNGAQFGFHYQPGSILKAAGEKDEHFALTSEWQRIKRDASNVAIAKFGTDVKITRTRID